jgi:uncharacterized protein (DUF427 family)
MSIRVLHSALSILGELRHEPVEPRIRASLRGEVVADSTRALLVWEPRRVVPFYAVPAEDLRATLTPAADPPPPVPGPEEAPVLHPGHPFALHSTPGTALDVHAAGTVLPGAAFRPDDPDLAGHVILDFAAFDAWHAEEELLLAHPRDGFHRVDAYRSTRHVRIELDGEVLAESTRPVLVTETSLPLRIYLPREDVRVPLVPSELRTRCAYKGEASYWSIEGAGERGADVVWGYEDPLPDVGALRGLVAFWDERVDVVLDGVEAERPVTAIAEALREEFGVPSAT